MVEISRHLQNCETRCLPAISGAGEEGEWEEREKGGAGSHSSRSLTSSILQPWFRLKHPPPKIVPINGVPSCNPAFEEHLRIPRKQHLAHYFRIQMVIGELSRSSFPIPVTHFYALSSSQKKVRGNDIFSEISDEIQFVANLGKIGGFEGPKKDHIEASKFCSMQSEDVTGYLQNVDLKVSMRVSP